MTREGEGPNMEFLNEKKEVKDNVPGEWMQVDNMEVSYVGEDQKDTVSPSNDPEEAGKFDHNNGVIVFVTPNGEKFVGPQTGAQLKALEEAGYTKSGMGVPMSNGEEPTDPHKKDLLRGMMARGTEQVKKETDDERKADFREAAKK